jgi:hypothetical protein
MNQKKHKTPTTEKESVVTMYKEGKRRKNEEDEEKNTSKRQYFREGKSESHCSHMSATFTQHT